MKRKTRVYNAHIASLAAIGLALVSGGFSQVAFAQELPSKADEKIVQQKKSEYSPYPDQHFPTRVFWVIGPH